MGGTDYTNKNDGVSIGVRENGEVEVIQYRPAAKDRNLLCPAAAAREGEIERGESAYLRPVLYYFDLSPKDEAVRLEWFADQSQKFSTESKIYIIGYSGRDACPNEGINRANRAKDQLISSLGVPMERIMTIDGGRNSAVWVEIFVVPPGGPRPLSSPDIHPQTAKLKTCEGTAKNKKNKTGVRPAILRFSTQETFRSSRHPVYIHTMQTFQPSGASGA